MREILYKELKDISSIIIPKVMENRESVWDQYSLLAKDKEMRNWFHFLKNNINAAIFYPVPLFKNVLIIRYKKVIYQLKMFVLEF